MQHDPCMILEKIVILEILWIRLDCMIILYDHVFNPTYDVYKVDLNYVSSHNEPLTITMFIVY